jgi:acylpyruvate hydrolase
MRFVSFQEGNRKGLAVAGKQGHYHGMLADEAGYPGSLGELIAGGHERLAAAHAELIHGREIDLDTVYILPPLGAPGKIICVGLNYADHTKESPYEQPDYPTLFPRFASSLIGHRVPIVRPKVSHQLDYEGELAVVIGRRGRHILGGQTLEHVAGYSIFNDGSVRDYQFKSPQWTVGKNFDATGAFGPAFVTTDEIPPGGAKGSSWRPDSTGTSCNGPARTTCCSMFHLSSPP